MINNYTNTITLERRALLALIPQFACFEKQKQKKVIKTAQKIFSISFTPKTNVNTITDRTQSDND